MMDTQQQALLGILGGMGPLATVDFLGKLTRLTPANCDQDHLPWVTVSQPGIPDRSAAIKVGNDGPVTYLIKGVAWLAAQGVSHIVIPCNTSHYWFDQMQAACHVPILHIADATIEELQLSESPIKSIAVLATRGTVKAGIYSLRLAAVGFDVVALSEDKQNIVDQIIKDVKGGDIERASGAMKVLLLTLSRQGVTTVILACTELPIANSGGSGASPNDLHLIDSSLALASVSLRRLGYSL
jgi:aspartate racemase